MPHSLRNPADLLKITFSSLCFRVSFLHQEFLAGEFKQYFEAPFIDVVILRQRFSIEQALSDSRKSHLSRGSLAESDTGGCLLRNKVKSRLSIRNPRAAGGDLRAARALRRRLLLPGPGDRLARHQAAHPPPFHRLQGRCVAKARVGECGPRDMTVKMCHSFCTGTLLWCCGKNLGKDMTHLDPEGPYFRHLDPTVIVMQSLHFFSRALCL